MNAAQYIFGGEHGEDSFARRLIRRSSNLILLDEFDKVSPGFYNAFYQMFDEGKFVDRNYTVDVSKCIIICTSNYQSEADAEKNLGSPIYSRFSKVVKFTAIGTDDKLKIARITYQNLLNNLPEQDKKLVPEGAVLPFYEKAIHAGAYSNIRILKNDMEEALYFEILQAKGILANT
jgi:MoxR-like ATPase